VRVHILKEKTLELSTPHLIHIYSMAGTWHALTLRSKCPRSRSCGYENYHDYENIHGCIVNEWTSAAAACCCCWRGIACLMTAEVSS